MLTRSTKWCASRRNAPTTSRSSMNSPARRGGPSASLSRIPNSARRVDHRPIRDRDEDMQDPPRSRRRASSRSARSRKRLLSPSITAELTCVSSPPTPGETDARRSDSQGVEAHPFALGTIARSTILSSSARFCFRGSIPSLCAPLSTFIRLAAGAGRWGALTLRVVSRRSEDATQLPVAVR